MRIDSLWAKTWNEEWNENRGGKFRFPIIARRVSDFDHIFGLHIKRRKPA
jgi:hypothetical protein